MKPLIQTTDDVAALRECALSWKGTPWTGGGGAVRGTGVSCHMLPYAILTERGHDAPTPPNRQTVLKREQVALTLLWMAEQSAHYAPVDLSDIAAGDVLLFDAGIGHLALSLGGTEVIHCWQNGGVHVANFADTNLRGRLLRAWRPVCLNAS